MLGPARLPMGSCLSRSSFTVNKRRHTETIRLKEDKCHQLSAAFLSAGPDTLRTYPVLFSMGDAENVLKDTDTGTYLLYKDFESDKIYLSVRLNGRVRHHRISEINRLFYLEKQPYPYLDSIIFYHRRHKLRGVRLQQQAQLSARVVKAFAQKVVAANGNVPLPRSASITPRASSAHRVSRSGSLTSLITSSSDSTNPANGGHRF